MFEHYHFMFSSLKLMIFSKKFGPLSMFLLKNDQQMTIFNYFGPRILFVRPGPTVGNNGLILNLTK